MALVTLEAHEAGISHTSRCHMMAELDLGGMRVDQKKTYTSL